MLIDTIDTIDKYTHSNLVYYKHNGHDEPYVFLTFQMSETAHSRAKVSSQKINQQQTR